MFMYHGYSGPCPKPELDAQREANGRATVSKGQTMSATDETLSDPLRIPLSDLLGRPPEHLIAECAKYLKDGETPVQRIERERRDTDAALTLLIREKERTKALEELLCSAHCIALRHGADTAWDTFAASIRALGIGAVTARVYKVPRDELA